MLVKDQIRSRMEQLGIKVPALARQLEVSDQTVRFWISGRNIPRRSQIPAIEAGFAAVAHYGGPSYGYTGGGSLVESPELGVAASARLMQRFL